MSMFLMCLSSGDEDESEHATLTSMSHGLRSLSSSTSKPNSSKHAARLWQHALHLETTECSTAISVFTVMSRMRACSAATSTPLAARCLYSAVRLHFDPSSSRATSWFFTKFCDFLLTE